MWGSCDAMEKRKRKEVAKRCHSKTLAQILSINLINFHYHLITQNRFSFAPGPKSFPRNSQLIKPTNCRPHSQELGTTDNLLLLHFVSLLLIMPVADNMTSSNPVYIQGIHTSPACARASYLWLFACRTNGKQRKRNLLDSIAPGDNFCIRLLNEI